MILENEIINTFGGSGETLSPLMVEIFLEKLSLTPSVESSVTSPPLMAEMFLENEVINTDGGIVGSIAAVNDGNDFGK